MEMEGVKIDLAQLRRYASSLGVELNEIQERVREMAEDPNLNILSPIQIGSLIFEKLKLDPKVKPKTGVRYSYPTDEETLSALAERHPIINEILEYRGVKKLLSTYIEPLPAYISPVTGRIHTTFNQALTATGRLSSSKPNLQNIPIRTERGKEIRKAFVPSRPDGVIVSADYSQIELRILAHVANEEAMIAAFRSGEDIHTMTAARVFGLEPSAVTPELRKRAKAVNFGILYGMGEYSLSEDLGISRAEAKRYIESYLAGFPSISAYLDGIKEQARRDGYVTTMFGRKRRIAELASSNKNLQHFGERVAMNSPIQGSSADIIKIAMINVSRKLKESGLDARLILQVHDELLIEARRKDADKAAEILQTEMENAVALSVPLVAEVSVGENWFDNK